MTREELQEMDARCAQSQQDALHALLRIEGYRKCLADLIAASVVAEDRAKKDAAAAADDAAKPAASKQEKRK